MSSKTDPDPPPLRAFLTDLELARRWGISPKTLRNKRVSGSSVAYVQLGGSVRYRLSDVLAFEAAHTRNSTNNGGPG